LGSYFPLNRLRNLLFRLENPLENISLESLEQDLQPLEDLCEFFVDDPKLSSPQLDIEHIKKNFTFHRFTSLSLIL